LQLTDGETMSIKNAKLKIRRTLAMMRAEVKRSRGRLKTSTDEKTIIRNRATVEKIEAYVLRLQSIKNEIDEA